MHLYTRLNVVWFAASMAAACTGRQVQAATYEQDVRPVIAAACVSCHGATDPEAGLDLSKFSTDADALADPAVWDRVAKRVNLFEMPPEGGAPLSDTGRATLVGWIGANRNPSEDCGKLPSDVTQPWFKGHVMSRRLTRDEYDNSIRDLVGLDLRPAAAFPADGSGGEGFDNVGDTQFVSPVLLEKYLTAASTVLDAALPAGEREAWPAEIAAARQRVLVEPDGDRPPREAARQTLARFARRAFRRPVGDDELENLLTLFDRGQARGDNFTSSIKLALQSVLISPHFLLLPEPEPDAEGPYRLNQHQLAARLAYLMWASLPDDELLALADEGRLYDDDVLQRQVRRMLADPKSHGFAAAFATQWLGLTGLGEATRPDSKRFPEFDDALAGDMRAEAIALFETVLREDRSVLDLLDSQYAIVNARLARHYGLPPVEGNELRKVSLHDRRRGGVLGLGAVLTSTSYPLRTSPVIRGKWVLETLLGSHMPPPPPDAGTLPEDDRDAGDLTFRQRLELHRTRPECAACHTRMDPLGFGLESFDAIGRWRHHNNGKPVDSSGQLPSGETFAGPAELKQILLKRKDEFAATLSRKMLGYALGRALSQFDSCVVQKSVENLQAHDYRSSALVETIVLSYPFQHRYARK